MTATVPKDETQEQFEVRIQAEAAERAVKSQQEFEDLRYASIGEESVLVGLFYRAIGGNPYQEGYESWDKPRTLAKRWSVRVSPLFPDGKGWFYRGLAGIYVMPKQVWREQYGSSFVLTKNDEWQCPPDGIQLTEGVVDLAEAIPLLKRLHNLLIECGCTPLVRCAVFGDI